ncbi:hypothetical protein [Luteimonas sp. TWI1416]|uniref:IS1096 element passenger TnpR family protein n=1 Tax=unclassified Luteimonas TaxID=2629088 RepID=UPI00320AE68C
MSAPLYRLRLRLNHVAPPVERICLVPADLSLARLHTVIQVVMGWQDEHLHEFSVGNGRNRQRFGPRLQTFGFGPPPLSEAAHTLSQIAPHAGSRFGYCYDFGDDWQHAIVVESVDAPAPTTVALHCLGATGACPPEDCGGPPGYAHLRDALADPDHEDHDDLREWLGEGFDPDACDVEAINAALVKLARRWKLPSVTENAAKAPSAERSANTTRAASQPLMLDPASAQTFIQTYKAVLLQIGGPPPDGDAFHQHLVDARARLVREPALLETAIKTLRKAGTALDAELLHAMRALHVQRWVYLRDTRSHSIFIDPEGDVAYGVLGLTQRLRDITGGSGLFVETAVLPYRGILVCDSLLLSSAWLGPDLRRSYTTTLSQLRAQGRYANDALLPPSGRAAAAPGPEPSKPQATASAKASHGAAASPHSSGHALVALATPGPAPTREQKTFARLVGQIERKRTELTDWRAWLDTYAERMTAEYAPLRRQQYAAEVELVRRLDAALASDAQPQLRKAQRDTLRTYLGERALELLQIHDGPDEAELAALLRKHTGDDIEALRDHDRVFEKAMAETMLGGLLGDDVVDGHEGEDAQSLFEHVQARLREREAEQQEAEPVDGRTRAAAERRAQAEREASQSVKEIFRKLIASLHPDREPDPAQRARKTELMQQVNRAYRANDLLQLLTLQLQIEQIDAAHMAALPPARLKHYNAVLRDQAQALDGELDALLYPVAMEMDLIGARPRRSELERALRMRIAQCRQWCQEIQDEIDALGDARRVDTLTRRLQARFRAEEREAAAELAQFETLFGLSGGLGLDTQRPGRGRKRKPR